MANSTTEHRSNLNESKTKMFRWALIGSSVVGILGLSIFFMTRSFQNIHSNIETQELNKLTGIVNTLVMHVDGDAFEQLLLRYPGKDGITTNTQDSVYQHIHHMLAEAQRVNNMQSDIYALTPATKGSRKSVSHAMHFVITSADKPYFRHPYNAPSALMDQYETGGVLHSYKSANGSWVSAFAPIVNSEGQVVGVLEVDTKLDEVLSTANADFLQSLIGISIFTLLAMVVAAYLAYRITQNIIREQRSISDRYRKMNTTFEVLSEFAKEIGEGEFENNLERVKAEENDLSQSLLVMRENLYQSKLEEEQRSWSVQGIAEFGEVLRTTSDDLKHLSDLVIRKLVNYLGANQGGIFILREDHEGELLELTGAYAFERKKYMEKFIRKGEGLVGQCWIEGQEIYLTDVPDSYVNITSGLGDANPRSILIVPMKINEEFIGVIELASFKVFQQHELDFVKRIAESIASTVSMVKVNERTTSLLTESQELAEQLQAQEEELRQNQEEMLATQEEMDRKIKELESRLEGQEDSSVSYN